MSDWRDGYESTKPEDADAPNRSSRQHYEPPGTMATAYKARAKQMPTAFPYGFNEEGGEGGGP